MQDQHRWVHCTAVTFNYTALNRQQKVETQCSLVPQLCPTVPSGERERAGGRKKATEQLSLSPCLVIVHTPPHAALCLRLLIMLWHVSYSWEALSLSEEKATWLPLSEGEEGNGDKMVMCWTSLDKAGCVLRHLRRDESSKLYFKLWKLKQNCDMLYYYWKSCIAAV